MPAVNIAAVGQSGAHRPDRGEKHALHTAWHFAIAGSGGGKQKKGKGSGAWEKGVKPLPSFSYAEDFWSQYARLVVPSAMPLGVTVYLFRAGLSPSWEAWPEGGAWSVAIPRESGNAQLLDSAWEALALAAIGESLSRDPDELCGCALSLRASEARLQLWTRQSKDEATQRAIADRVRALLHMLPAEAELSYVPHTSKRKELASRSSAARGGAQGGAAKEPQEAGGQEPLYVQ